MRRAFLLLALMALAFPARAAESVTSGTLTVDPTGGVRGAMTLVTFEWVSDSGGDVVATTEHVSGTIERIVYNPGITSPTANYDVALTDQDGVDVLNGTGENLSATVTSSTLSTVTDGTTIVPFATMGTLSLAITNAGNAKGGIIRIYLRR